MERDRRRRPDGPLSDRVPALCGQTTWGQNAEVLSEARDDDGLPARVDAADPGERVFELYEAGEHLWWMSPLSNNWNAAINGGTMLAALCLLDDERAARIAAKTCRDMRHYLAGFDADGCTAEGVGYWNFGFGNYVQAAANLEAHTGGAYALLEVPVVERIATFPLRVELSREQFVLTADHSLF